MRAPATVNSANFSPNRVGTSLWYLSPTQPSACSSQLTTPGAVSSELCRPWALSDKVENGPMGISYSGRCGSTDLDSNPTSVSSQLGNFRRASSLLRASVFPSAKWGQCPPPSVGGIKIHTRVKVPVCHIMGFFHYSQIPSADENKRINQLSSVT